MFIYFLVNKETLNVPLQYKYNINNDDFHPQKTAWYINHGILMNLLAAVIT